MQSGEQFVTEKFLSLLAHELRNPLAPAMNALFFLEQDRGTKSPLVKNAVEVLGRQLNQITATISDLLDIARFVSGELEIDRRRVEVCELVEEVVKDLSPVFRVRKLLTDVTLPETGVWVLGDRDRIHQILSRLLANAAKFSETGGRVSVTLGHDEKQVMVNVRDEGVGMPVDVQPALFDLCDQSEFVRHMTQGGGLGVGLKLARQLATLHGGTIEAHSRGVSKGSEFSVILPVTEITEAREKKPDINEPDGEPLTVMVVDDHPDTAESLATVLKIWGHDVRLCHSGTAAIEMGKLFQPDVALLDIGLPGCDGYQVATRLREESKGTALIAVTGYGHRIDRKRSHLAGFQQHLVKPVSAEKLKKALSSLKPVVT